ncbi:MAG TPA: tripartite tricarboxylate transporter substrate-binding protein [Burkholderiales bacterium]|nr:tripartite tricarboxylate transporter substrate-binding protein [Burkholderiales bacterium]
MRAIAPALSDSLGKPVVIDTRAGAAGVIGTDIAAKAAPDGYTLLLGFQGPLAIAPYLTGAPYDSVKDFAPVSLVAGAPFVLVVNPRVPASSVKELVALARSRPGKLNYASGGRGIGSHMQMELLMNVAGVSLTHVPYKGSGPAVTAIVAAEVDAGFMAVAAALPHMKADRVRALAVGSDKRLAILPDLATFAESGYAVKPTSWYGVVAPRATPKAIVALLHDKLVRIVDAPAMRSRLVDMGFEVNASTPEEFASVLREEIATWRKVIDAAGLKGKGA